MKKTERQSVLGLPFDSNVAVYPNPTTSNVTVSAPGMNHITVFNAMGQMVMDMPVSNDSQVLDMSQYKLASTWCAWPPKKASAPNA